MAAAKRSGSRRRGSARGRAATGGVWNVVWTLVVIGLALAFLRVNGIYDLETGLAYFRSVGRETTQVTAPKFQDAISKSCNFVKDASCLYSHDTLAKIGDVNKDGSIDTGDSEAYAKENGISLPARPPASTGNGGSSASNDPTSTPSTDDGSSQQTGVTVPASDYITKLDALEVKDPDKSDYSRSDYKHWVTVDKPCDAREESLKRAGFSVDPKTCRAKAGFKYTDPYTGKTIDDPKKLDIDHVIPLGRANATGAKKWTPGQKEAYANDVDTVLLPVDASANRQKSDKGPGEWMPSNQTYHCTYAKKYIDIASKYKLWISASDKTALRTALSKCQ